MTEEDYRAFDACLNKLNPLKVSLKSNVHFLDRRVDLTFSAQDDETFNALTAMVNYLVAAYNEIGH